MYSHLHTDINCLFYFVDKVLPMLIGNAFGMPQQGNPCDANPCGENNICTSNGGAVSCECAPGKIIQKYDL